MFNKEGKHYYFLRSIPRETMPYIDILKKKYLRNVKMFLGEDVYSEFQLYNEFKREIRIDVTFKASEEEPEAMDKIIEGIVMMSISQMKQVYETANEENHRSLVLDRLLKYIGTYGWKTC